MKVVKLAGKFKTSAFYSDRLELSLIDILNLLLGYTLKDGALYVKIGKLDDSIL